FDDLIIGAPGDELGGSVWVVPGSETGLLFDDLTMIRQGVDRFDGVSEAGDEFGFALTWTLVSHPTIGSPLLRILAVGVPGENQQIGQLRLYQAHPPLPNSQALRLSDYMMFEQSDINGDLVSG